MSKSKNGFGIAWPPNLHIGSIFFIRGYLNIIWRKKLFYVKIMSNLEALTAGKTLKQKILNKHIERHMSDNIKITDCPNRNLVILNLVNIKYSARKNILTRS
jgi:hypothetical protein